MTPADQKNLLEDYNIVVDTLKKKLDALEEMQRGRNNTRRSVGGGVGTMDSIRYEQIDEISKAIKREQSLAAQAASTERAPLVRLSDEELDEIRQADNGALNFVTLKQFKSVAYAVMGAMERVNRSRQ